MVLRDYTIISPEIGVLKLEKAMRYESTSLMLRIIKHYNSIKIINLGFTFLTCRKLRFTEYYFW